MTASDPTSPIHDADPPPFHQLDPLRFESLLVDLLQEEDGVVFAELHGTSGQADFGVDAIGTYGDGTFDLISCKRYAEITPRDLANWSQDMLKHWSERWSGFPIRRFILATSATNIARMQIINQIPSEFERFRRLGIRYEIWGPTRLRTKLAPHRRLAAAYLKEHWADSICGPAAPPTARIAQAPLMLEAGVLAQMAELQNMLSGEVAARVEDALELLRQGRLGTVRALAEELQKEPRWGQLNREAQAGVLRLEGSAALTDGDLPRAKALDAAANARHSPDEPRLSARIAAELGDAEDGLTVLGHPTSLAGRQLRSALLLAAGRHEAARAELLTLRSEHADDPETLRLLALERLGSGERGEAHELITKVETVAGNWLATRRAGAIIRYALALSPSLGPEWTLVPNPVDADLVRRDRPARAWLNEAIDLLDGIPDDLRSTDDDLWRLAILASIDGRRGDAVRLAHARLDRHPADAMVVGWAIMRDFDVDLGPSRSALEEAYRAGTGSPEVRVLGMLLASDPDQVNAADFLERYLDKQDKEQRSEASLWVARFRGVGMDRNSEILYNAQRHDDWAPAEALLEELLAVEPPHPFGLTIAELAAGANRWTVLTRNIDRLTAYESANGVRIAVVAAMNCRRFGKALKLLDVKGAAFGPQLPADMRRLRAEALARSGQFRTAISEATTLAAQGHLDDALFEAELRARVGSVRQASFIVKRALKEGHLGSTLALQWSQRLRHADPALAKELVRAAVSAGVEEAHVLAAWNEAVELGLEAESSQLMPRIAARAAGGDPAIMTISVDKAQEFIRDLMADEERVRELYMSGAIPVHLYARGRPDVLLRIHRLNDVLGEGTSAAIQPRLLRHGGRPVSSPALPPFSRWRMHLDVTALLESQRAGLLDRLESHPNGVVVSARLPGILQQMQLSVRRGPDHRQAYERILRLAANRAIEVREWTSSDVPCVRLEDEDGPGHPLRDLLGILLRTGVLSSEEAMSLADGAELSAQPQIDLSNTLAVSTRAVIALASSALLDRIVRHVPLAIDASTLEQVRASLSGAQHDDELAATALTLAQRVGDGILAGTYHLLPLRSDDESGGSEEGTDGSEDEDGESGNGGGGSLIEQQLAELLSLSASDDAVVWFEDRNLTGYVTAGSVPIVSMMEVLSAMRASEDLSGREHHELLTAFRKSGAGLLPFTTDEVLEPLLDAPVVDHRLMETPELSDVRRAFAATRTLEPHLKIGPATDLLKDRPDEDLVARSTMRMFSEILHRIWSDGLRPIDECMARSDWLLEAVRVRRLFRVPPTGDVDENLMLFEAMQMGHCFDKAWEVGGPRDVHEPHRTNYLNWCWQRMVVPRAGMRPDIVEAIGDYLARFYGALMQEGLESGRIDAVTYERLLFLRVKRLPEPIATRVRAAGIFPNHVRYTTGVVIKSHRVASGRFWRAMREAARYGRSSMRSDHGRRLLLRRTSEGVSVSGAVKARMEIEVALVLAARPVDIADAVHAHLERLDLDPVQARDLAQCIAQQRDPAQVASTLQKAEATSTLGRARKVDQSLRHHRGTSLTDLEPGRPEQLAWHHRIDLERDSSGEDAWAPLSRSVGVVEAFVRLAALPSSLPAGSVLNPAEVDDVVAAARTPMALAGAGRLLREAGREETEIVAVIARFVDVVERWGRLFVEMLQWTLARTKLGPDWSAIDPYVRLRLCWLHADWLVRSFERHGFDPAALVGSFPVREERLQSIDQMVLSPTGPADQADPSTITPQVLLMHGLAAVLGDIEATNVLPDELLTRIHAFFARDDAGKVVDPGLLLRNREQGDALGGFLLAVPKGLFDPGGPTAFRNEIIDLAIAKLSEDATDREAWLGLVAFATRGLDPDRAQTLAALIDAVDVFAAAHLEGQEPQSFIWRGIMGPLSWNGQPVVRRLASLASRCSRTFAGVVRSDTPAELAFNELIESCLNAARISYLALDHNMACRHLWTIATEWPACAPLMRRFVMRLLDGAVPTGNEAFWRLGNDLNRLP